MQTSKIITIAGPTASGKSGLALDLAQSLNGVIINADSMQVYKDIPILAATPTKEEQSLTPHKLYGIYDASYHGNVVEWANLCKQAIDEAFANKQTPIIVGGTGMYIEALTEGLTPIPETSSATRQHVEDMLTTNGLEYLYNYLEQIDKDTHTRLAPNDTTRIKRAIEIFFDTKKTISYWRKQPLKKLYNNAEFTKIYISPSREELNQKLRYRFDKMIELGAIMEVQAILKKKLPDNLPAMRALGVQELKLYLENKLTLEEAIELAKLHTRQYAKRQSTWFNNRYHQDFLYSSCYNTDNFFVDDIKKSL